MSDNLSEDKKQVEALVRDIFQCFVEHRPDDMTARIHEQSTIWDVFVPELLMGVEEKQKYYAADQEQSQARGPLKLTVEPPVIDVWGDVGLARYYLNFDYAPPHPTSGRVRITTVVLRVDGEWKMVHHHEGIVPSGVPDFTDGAVSS